MFFLGYQTTNNKISKLSCPNNDLVYVNQGSITPVKGKRAIYLDYVIMGQLIPAMYNSKNIEVYKFKPNEVKLITPLYYVDSGKFLGLEKRLAFIMVRVDQGKPFFSDGYDKVKSKNLYYISKKLLPNIFSGTCFKKHRNILVQQQMRQETSTFSFYLSFTTDRSNNINQFR